MKFMLKKVHVLVLICLLNHCIKAQEVNSKARFVNGESAIAAVRNAYAEGKWYRNFTFSQHTAFYKDGKLEKTEIWHEASSSPGKLLIKFNKKDSKDGVLFENNRVHVYKEGKEELNKVSIHDLCLAAFDIYFLKINETTHLLDSLGFNLKICSDSIFNGRKVFVIGAEKNDSTANQLWYDAERFYLHRIIYKKGKGLRDVVLTDYAKIKNNWVATKVIFKENGILNMEEKYFDIKFPKKFSDKTFNPEKFAEVVLD